MITMFFHSAQQLKRSCPAKVTLSAVNLISQACLYLVEGQIFDVAFEQRENITISEYLRMIDSKTISLLDCFAQLGSLIAGVEPSFPYGIIKKIHLYSRALFSGAGCSAWNLG